MSMPFIDEITALQSKIDLIDRPDWGAMNRPSPTQIIEASFWARSILEIIEDTDLSQLGHSVKNQIRTLHNIEDPDHPGSAKAIYDANKTLQLIKLLGYIVHTRYFSFSIHADGNHCLDVMSDRHDRTLVYFSDFTDALKSLVLPPKSVAIAICQLTEKATQKRLSGDYGYEITIFSSINFGWVLWNFVQNQPELKRRILSEIFQLHQVPDHALDRLFFAVSRTGPADQMVIGFGPPWEDEQNVLSPPFKRELLYDIIKSS